MNKLERNIPLTYIYSILMKRVTMPIIIIYFLLNSLNFTEIAFLAAIAAIVGLIFEIPAGAFADKHGKKTAMLLVGVFGFCMMAIYFFGNGFLEFAIASVFLGLWSAFTSGTRAALIYDTLLELKRKQDYKKVYGKMILYSYVGNALILLAIPVLYAVGIKLPFIVGMIFAIITIAIAMSIKEPKIKTNKDHKYIRSSLKEIIKKKKVLFLIILMMVTFASIFAASEFKQPLFLIAGIDIIYFGIFYALMRACGGLGGMLPHKIQNNRFSKIIGITAILTPLIGFIFFFSGIWITIIGGVLIIALGEGLLRVSIYDSINHLVSSSNRTTIFSIASVLQQLYKAGFVLVMGIYADIIGVTEMFGIAAIIFVIAIGITFIVFKNHASTILT